LVATSSALCAAAFAKPLPGLERHSPHLVDVAVLAITLVLVTILSFSWMTLPNIALANEELLDEVARATENDKLIVNILRVAEHSNSFTNWLNIMSGLAYPVLVLLLVAALARLSVHPRPGFFKIVFWRGLSELLHLGLVALFLFLVLAFTALLVFGPYIESYATFSSSLSSQLRWLFCEFLTNATMPGRLPTSGRIYYYIYAVSFLLLANWLFLFLIPAVLINAFGTLRPSNSQTPPSTGDV